MKVSSLKSIVLFLSFTATVFSCSKKDNTATEVPTVSTLEIFEITDNSAKTISEVIDNGGGEIISKGVCYGTSVDPSISESKTTDGGGMGSFLSEIEGLEPEKEYFIRAYATNEIGTAYGKNISFKTTPLPIIKGDLNLDSQAEIDLLFKSDIEIIEGDLYVGLRSDFNKSAVINSLSSMSSLKEVKGDLVIINTRSLKNLEGLNNIEKIGRNIIISHNQDLSDIDIFNNFNKLEGGITLISNPELVELNGFNSVTSLSGDLRISGNDKLESISGLESLSSISGELSIWYNLSLQNISGLKNLTSIQTEKNWYQALSIVYNDKLTDLEGFNQLKEIKGGLKIDSNAGLESLDGLNNLTKIDGDLEINNNNVLENIKALSNLETILRLHINGNHKLQTLDGLENLKPPSSSNAEISIINNNQLSDYCAIKDFVSNINNCSDDNSLGCDYSVYGNAYNPEYEDMKNGKCKEEK